MHVMIYTTHYCRPDILYAICRVFHASVPYPDCGGRVCLCGFGWWAVMLLADVAPADAKIVIGSARWWPLAATYGHFCRWP